MLYMATSVELSLLDTPALSIEEIEPDLAVIKQWFSLPHAYFLGAHTGCSCGFPSVVADTPVDYYEGIFNGAADRTQDLESVRALLTLVRQASAGSPVELLPVWAGDEADPPNGTIVMSVHSLKAEEFFFMEGFLYCLTA